MRWPAPGSSITSADSMMPWPRPTRRETHKPPTASTSSPRAPTSSASATATNPSIWRWLAIAFAGSVPERLNGSEQLEYLVGLGEELYLEGFAGAAADLFDTVFDTTAWMPDASRERVLDWWASALDHEARPRSDIDRQPIYQRIRDRMRGELGRKPASTVASYWLSAAAAGQGDHQTAWDSAMAGWVRAPLADDHGVALRGELDHLVMRQIVPQRARALAQPPDAVQQEWDDFKERWTK